MQSSRLQPTGSYQAGAPRLLPTCRDRCSQPGASRPAPGPARAQPRTAPQAHSGCSEAKVDLSTPSRRLSLTALCRRAAAYTRTAFGFVSSLRASVVCQASSSKRGSTSGASSPKRDDDAALHDEPGDSSQAMSESVSKDDVIAIIKRFPGPGQGKWIGFINKHWDTICWDGITAKDSPVFLLEFLHYQQHELEPDDAVVTMSPARMKLLGTKPSSMTVSLMKQITRLAKGPAYLCYRPEYVGPPQQLPATLVHEAFGVVRKGLTDTSKLPSINAQHLALQLTDIMPEVYPSELIRRTTWLGVFKEWLDLEFGGKLIIKQGMVVEVPGSEYVVDAVIMTQDGRWVAVFEFKQDEQCSYEQGQSYFAQRLNVMKPEERGAGIHPAFLIEKCGPSLRLCAMYLAGPVPSSPDIQAMVCEPLTPQQHFFHMPQDYPYMLSLARMLDSFKDGLAKLVEDPQIDQGSGTRSRPYVLPYTLRGPQYHQVQHCGQHHLIYTAIQRQAQESGEPQGDRGEGGEPEGHVGEGGQGEGGELAGGELPHDELQDEGLEDGEGEEKEGGEMEEEGEGGESEEEGEEWEEDGSSRPVLVKFTSHEYAQTIHDDLAEHEVAPKLYGCTELSGGYRQVVMEHLSEEEGWRRLSDLIQPGTLSSEELTQVIDVALRTVERMHRVTVIDPVSGKACSVVHGDLRPENILLRQRIGSDSWEDAECRIVDFDWAGLEGITRYPAFLNYDLPRPDDVLPGTPIRREHDVEFLSNYLPRPDAAGDKKKKKQKKSRGKKKNAP